MRCIFIYAYISSILSPPLLPLSMKATLNGAPFFIAQFQFSRHGLQLEMRWCFSQNSSATGASNVSSSRSRNFGVTDLAPPKNKPRKKRSAKPQTYLEISMYHLWLRMRVQFWLEEMNVTGCVTLTLWCIPDLEQDNALSVVIPSHASHTRLRLPPRSEMDPLQNDMTIHQTWIVKYYFLPGIPWNSIPFFPKTPLFALDHQHQHQLTKISDIFMATLRSPAKS